MINRDIPSSGYWDYPVSTIKPDEAELHLLRYFDFDIVGYREYRYFEVSVRASATYPEIVGRSALIEVEHARVMFGESE
jgi:hypothetical protein